jgi:hypothetical protein
LANANAWPIAQTLRFSASSLLSTLRCPRLADALATARSSFSSFVWTWRSPEQISQRPLDYAALVALDFFANRFGSNEISSLVPVAFAIRLNVERLGAAFPLSRRATVD